MKRTVAVGLLLALTATVAALLWQDAARQALVSAASSRRARPPSPPTQTFPGPRGVQRRRSPCQDHSMIAHLRRGETYRRRGETGQALRDLRAAARLDPTATRPLELLGDLNGELERYARAAESYEAYLRLDDRSPRVLYKLALARYPPRPAGGRARPASAGPHARRPSRGGGTTCLALCQRTLDRPSEAAAALEWAVRLSPGLIAAREELADLYSVARRDTRCSRPARGPGRARARPGRASPRDWPLATHAPAAATSRCSPSERSPSDEPEDPAVLRRHRARLARRRRVEARPRHAQQGLRGARGGGAARDP